MRLKKLLLVPDVRFCVPVPLNVTVPLVGVNVPPVPVQLPPTVMLRPLLSRVPTDWTKFPVMTRLFTSSVKIQFPV